MTYLLDTCILSCLRKISKYPDPLLEAWVSQHAEHQYSLSVVTIGEIQSGISKCQDNRQKRVLEDWLLGSVVPRFEGRVLSLDSGTMLCWGELVGSHKKRGISLPAMDSLLAASAIHHNLILVTRNSKDFELMDGLKFLNPWEDSAGGFIEI